MRLFLAMSMMTAAAASGWCQGPSETMLTLPKADSAYIRKYPLKNDVRLFYGGRGNSLTYESVRSSSANIQGSLYRNIGDFLGFGVKYKLFDIDASFALPGTTYLKEERSNLEQFNLSARFTTRRFMFRGFYTDSRGVVASSANDLYASPPSASEIRWGLQTMYFLNASRYSFRAALYQNEVQVRPAGSFLIGGEIFYRDLRASSGLTVPAYDTPTRYGEQAGMKSLQAPGIILMPGYAYTYAWKGGHYFVSGLLSGGAGVAFNRYQADAGSNTRNNLEVAGNLMLSGGYNGEKSYLRILVLGYGRYELIDPAFLTSTNLVIDCMVGYRFANFDRSK